MVLTKKKEKERERERENGRQEWNGSRMKEKMRGKTKGGSPFDVPG